MTMELKAVAIFLAALAIVVIYAVCETIWHQRRRRK